MNELSEDFIRDYCLYLRNEVGYQRQVGDLLGQSLCVGQDLGILVGWHPLGGKENEC